MMLVALPSLSLFMCMSNNFSKIPSVECYGVSCYYDTPQMFPNYKPVAFRLDERSFVPFPRLTPIVFVFLSCHCRCGKFDLRYCFCFAREFDFLSPLCIKP